MDFITFCEVFVAGCARCHVMGQMQQPSSKLIEIQSGRNCQLSLSCVDDSKPLRARRGCEDCIVQRMLSKQNVCARVAVVKTRQVKQAVCARGAVVQTRQPSGILNKPLARVAVVRM